MSSDIDQSVDSASEVTNEVGDRLAEVDLAEKEEIKIRPSIQQWLPPELFPSIVNGVVNSEMSYKDRMKALLPLSYIKIFRDRALALMPDTIKLQGNRRFDDTDVEWGDDRPKVLPKKRQNIAAFIECRPAHDFKSIQVEEATSEQVRSIIRSAGDRVNSLHLDVCGIDGVFELPELQSKSLT